LEFVWAQTGNGRFLAYYGKIILMPEILMGSNSCIDYRDGRMKCDGLQPSIILANRILFFPRIYWSGINRLPVIIQHVSRVQHVLNAKIALSLVSSSPIIIVSTCPLQLPGNVL
jgi:hypothetical protein